MEENSKEIGIKIDLENEQINPLDIDKISIDKKTISIETCLERIEKGTIKTDSFFKEKTVWDIKKMSLFIESLILKIPITMFYVQSDSKGILTIIDGLQRINTIKDFINVSKKGESFKLKDLETLKNSYEGKTFKELPNDIQNRLLKTEFTFVIINPATPDIIKNAINQRINIGHNVYSTQQIRHSFLPSKTESLLTKLIKNKDFILNIGTKNFIEQLSENINFKNIKDNDSIASDLILRFIAFLLIKYTEYPMNNNMDSFLAKAAELIKHIDDKPTGKETPVKIQYKSQIEERFDTAMIRAKKLFVEKPFRKNNADAINQSLFEVWSVTLCWLNENDYKKLLKYKTDFEKLNNELLENQDFLKSISEDSWKYLGVIRRYELVDELIKKIINKT